MALCEQAVALYQAGRVAEAERLCVQVRGAEPGNFIAAYIQGVIQFLRGERGAALASIEAAMAADPEAPQPLIYHGLLQEAAGRDELALVSYGKAISLQPDMVEALLHRGNVRQKLGQSGPAMADFDLALKHRPDFAAALFGRAAALQNLNRPAEALAAFDRLLARDAGLAAGWNNRGLVLRDLQRLDKALASIDKAIALQPDYADAWNNRGVVLRDLKRLDEALASYDKAISLQPDYAYAWNNRGVVLRGLKRPDEALAGYDKALALRPDYADAWDNRGAALRELKRPDEALASIDRAIALQPGFANAWANHGAVMRDLKRPDAALASYDKVIALDPRFAQAWSDRGAVLQDFNRLDEALASIDKAIALKPDQAGAWSNRSAVLQEMKRPDEALASADKAIAIDPRQADAWSNRGGALLDLKQLVEAAASFGKALGLEPDREFLLGDYLQAKMRVCDWEGLEDDLARCAAGIRQGRKIIMPFSFLVAMDDPELQKMAARIYSEAKYPAGAALGPVARRPRAEKIRIGYYSADFHNHATAFLLAELLEAHDESRFELHGFSFGPDVRDGMRQRAASAFADFTDVRSMSDRDVARLSRARGIDIAVDLKGHTRDSRPGIFAEGCAPAQLAYLGYPGTMGADYMDYMVADATVIPAGSEKYYTEKIVRLPGSYQANDSRRKISGRLFTRQESGLPESGFVFCCFNNNYKILPETFESWMRILQAVDGSALWLLEANPWAAENLRKEAKARGVGAARLVFAGHLPLDEHLARHRLADLFLDNWPCNAHTTASDALWAGLPVLTFPGQSFVSRVAASLLKAVGLPGLIAGSREDYETLAIAVAKDPPRLAGLRETLADNRATAPLFDGKRTARNLEAAYEAIHARCQAGLPPDHITIEPA